MRKTSLFWMLSLAAAIMFAQSAERVLAEFPASRSVKVEAGTVQEPVRYTGKEWADCSLHDGGLRPAVGASNFQVMRANRSHTESSDGFGWTYNHAAMLAYWNHTFFLEYLSNPADEHVPPGHTLLVTSKDGIHWDMPRAVFPVYTLADGSPAMMHQRMGFYAAPNGRLLVMGFIGFYPDPVNGTGIGRVVREIYKDNSFGPIYFLKYNTQKGWGEQNTHLPYYIHSEDAGFKEACDSILRNRLMRAQWWDEEQSTDGFYSVGGYEALSFYHRKDGKVVGLWKWSHAALSEDEGKTWSPVVKVPSFVMDGAKFWGQRTTDGRYAVVYNPSPQGEHRWPLAVATSEDGISFDNLSCIHGEVPMPRFKGRWKDYGPQYNRGIEEGNGTPPDGALWDAYSVNKEDIWIVRVSVPVRIRVDSNVNDNFDGMDTGGIVVDWNIYSPKWANVSVVNFPSSDNKSLELQNGEPYDYSRAVRIFPESHKASLSFKIYAHQNDYGRLEIDVLDHSGKRPVQLVLDEKGSISFTDGTKLKSVGNYSPGSWMDFNLVIDLTTGRYSLDLDHRSVATDLRCACKVGTVERISFRTGKNRTFPELTTVNQPGVDLPDPDRPVNTSIFNIDDVKIVKNE